MTMLKIGGKKIEESHFNRAHSTHLESPSTLPKRIRLYKYLILFGGSQPISACFLPFLTSQTSARPSFEIETTLVLSGLNSMSSISLL